MNPQAVNFTGKYKTDKVTYESPILEYTVGGGSTNTATIPKTTQGNLITLAWSVDGTNFYPANAYVTLTNTYTANGWVDGSNVYIYCENNTGGNLTFYVKYVLDVF